MREICRTDCMWERVAATKKPILLYGTGNGADKLLRVLNTLGRTPDGVFASDGFVRRRTYAGMPVLSYTEAREQFGEDMLVLIAFGSSLPDVMAQMESLDARHETYIPELPLYGTDLFTYDYFLAHRDEIAAAEALLEDNISRALYREILTYRLTGSIRLLARTETPEVSYRENFADLSPRCALDGGAYRGDSAAALLRALPTLRTVYAAEPDGRTFCRLSDYAAGTDGAVVPLPYALSDREETVVYAASGSRGAGMEGKNRRAREETVSLRRIDRLPLATPPDLIKLDVEGEEMPALCGAAETLAHHTPALAVSLYHRTEDFFRIPQYLAQTYPGVYRYRLRRAPCYPAWDLVLLAVPR